MIGKTLNVRNFESSGGEKLVKIGAEELRYNISASGHVRALVLTEGEIGRTGLP